MKCFSGRGSPAKVLYCIVTVFTAMFTLRDGGLLPVLVLLLVLVPSAALLVPRTYPNLAIRVTAGGRPVSAFVQVFALLPPGSRASMVEVWNGTAPYGTAYVPLSSLVRVARAWLPKMAPREKGVGLEVFATSPAPNGVETGFRFFTYSPSALLSAASDPLAAVAGFESLTVPLSTTLPVRETSGPDPTSTPASAQTPTPPAPAGYAWVLLGQGQSGETELPLFWGSWDTGEKEADATLTSFFEGGSSTAVSFGASAALGYTSFTYQIVGSSVSGTPNNYDVAEVDFLYPQAYTYTEGTIGEAEFQLYQVDESTGAEWPVSPPNYSYEAYVQSCDFNVYANETGAPPFPSALYSNVTYYPFDTYDITASSPYHYAFGSAEASGSDFSLAIAVPIGAILEALGFQLIPAEVLPALVATITVTSNYDNLNYLLLATSQGHYTGVVLVSALDVSYELDGTTFIPSLEGVEFAEGSYSASTSMLVFGPQGVPGGSTDTYSAFVLIGGTTYLIPNVSSVSYSYTTPYGSYSGGVQVPWHNPAVLNLYFPNPRGPSPGYQTTVHVTYVGGSSSVTNGTVSYSPCSLSFTVNVEAWRSPPRRAGGRLHAAQMGVPFPAEMNRPCTQGLSQAFTLGKMDLACKPASWWGTCLRRKSPSSSVPASWLSPSGAFVPFVPCCAR